MIIKETSSELNSWNCITFLKCLAALLITNAHLGPFYPERFQFLSFGGALGNSLFFLCSGWALVGGVKKMAFPNWYIKRAIRVMIPVWIFMLISSCLNINTYHWNQLIQTPYWFLNAILIFYIPFYFIAKYASRNLIFICALLFLGFFIEFELVPHDKWMLEESVNDVYIHYWYYFVMMLLGAYIRLHDKCIHYSPNKYVKKSMAYTVLTVIAFLSYMGNKYYIIHMEAPLYQFQLLLPILLIMFAVCFFYLSKCLSILKPSICNNRIVSFVAEITLEIYIVQFTTSHYLVTLPFPFALISNICVILFVAKLLHYLSSKIVNLIY